MGDKDVISKEIIRQLAVDLANILLKLDIEPDSVELIDSEQQRIEERRADLVAKVRQKSSQKFGESFILHIEIQNNKDATMPLRMLRYFTDIALANRKLPIRQFLIYIGKDQLRMPPGITTQGLDYQFHILDMHQVDCAALLAQDDPNALVLAILCDFGPRAPQSVVNEIFLRLQTMLGDNEKGLRTYIDKIEILSDNRDLAWEIQEAQDMLTEIDRRKMPSYKTGHQDGLIEGRSQGLQLGEAKVLRRLLVRRFGALPDWAEARLTQASEADLETWADRVLDCDSLQQIFA